MIVRNRVPPPVAVATTIAVVLAAAAAAPIWHLYNLTFGHSAGGFAQVLLMLVFTIPGVVLGDQLGPYIQACLDPATTQVVIALARLGVGSVMLSV